MLQNSKILSGYDPHGIVYDVDEFILRKINSSYSKKVEILLEKYKSLNLSNFGIVETERFLFNEEDFLKHKKYLTSYPHEWSANMFKDAALFHLNLYLDLDKFDLTLKDAIPNNIIFNGTNLVFVDFLSMVFKQDLVNEEWLISDYEGLRDLRFAVLEKMFFPYILFPLLVLDQKRYGFARELLLSRACNSISCNPPCIKDVYKEKGNLSFFKNWINGLKLSKKINFNNKTNFIDFVKNLFDYIKNIDVSPSRSDYDSYYESKKENFPLEDQSNWGNKQKGVYSVLTSLKPKTVLDLGANTGWFSILAAKNGAKVAATDIDESSIDLLYQKSKKEKLDIVSLFISFDDLTQEQYGIDYNVEGYEERDFKNNPLFLAPINRLKSELVLCLALVHHLVLGEGKSIKDVFRVLSDLTSKTLVLEYISFEDNVIKNEPSFFKNLSKYTADSYNLDLFISEGKKFFKEVEVLESHPNTRKLLIFNK